MAKIRDLADALASRGRGQDSLLAHINPREAMMLKAHGGSGKRNPRTGIIEFDDGDYGGFGGGSGSDAGGTGAPGGGSGSGFGGSGEFGGGDIGTTDSFESNFSPSGVLGNTPDQAAMDFPTVTVTGNSTPDANMNTGFESNFLPSGALGNTPDSFESNFSPSEAIQPPNTDFFSKLKDFIQNKALNSLFAKAGIPGAVVGPAMAMANPNATPSTVGNSAIGSLANFATMGAFGLAKGLGSALGMSPDQNQSNNANNGGATGAGGGSMDLNGILQGLGGLYMGNRASNQYNNQVNSLNDLYSPNSPYAQNLRQQLERRDAAAGRRSQYGTRETELMGNLAQAHGQALTSPGYQAAMGNRERTQNQGLGALLTMLNKGGGGGLQGMLHGGGLQSLFNNGYSNNWNLGPNAGPQAPIDTQGITDMFNQGGGNGSPWEEGWGQ